MPTKIQVSGKKPISVSAFIDSGADTEFIDNQFAQWLEIKMIQTARFHKVHALDGHYLHNNSLETMPVKLLLSCNHHESIKCIGINSPQIPIILRATWLCKHNPKIIWRKKEIVGWSEECLSSCLFDAVSPTINPCNTEETYPNLSKVPSDYHDLEVFNKAKATSLLPHRPYDYPIDLIPGTTPPRGSLCYFSGPENQAMQNYINESLQASIIRPSASPAGAGLFFIEEKDGSPRPCINYRGLNKITIKNKYPLPIMTSAFDLIQGAMVFTKLDLWNAYHLVHIIEGDEWKMAFSTPTGHYEYLVMTFGLF